MAISDLVVEFYEGATGQSWSPAAGTLISSARLVVTDSLTASINQITVPSSTRKGTNVQKVVAKFKCLDGECFINIAAAPSVFDATKARHLASGETLWEIVTPGQKIAAIDAGLAS